jgi:hypothetical protein
VNRFVALAALVGCTEPPPVHHPILNCVQPGDGPPLAPGAQGRWFNVARVAELAPGDATVTDATCALGEPFITTDSGDGTSMISWMYMSGTNTHGVIAMHGASALLQFGPDGRMLRIIAVNRTH